MAALVDFLVVYMCSQWHITDLHTASVTQHEDIK